MAAGLAALLAFVGLAEIVAALPQRADLPPSLHGRVDQAIRTAFASLYALPPDTAGVTMETWVLDVEGTTAPDARASVRNILVRRLTDTGKDLNIRDEMTKFGAATTAQEMAEAAAAMQRLEGRISKAEAEAVLEVVVSLNATEIALTDVAKTARQSTVELAGASVAVRVEGAWITVEDRDLGVNYERWAPAGLLVAFGRFEPLQTRRPSESDGTLSLVAGARGSTSDSGLDTVGVRAQGSAEMIERLVQETNWQALAGLIGR